MISRQKSLIRNKLKQPQTNSNKIGAPQTIFNQSPINISDEVFEGALESFLAIRGKIIKQKERVRNKQQKQSEHKF